MCRAEVGSGTLSCVCGWEEVSPGCSSGASLEHAAPALKAHDGLAALHVVCTRQEVPLGLAFQHTSWAMSAQERKERLVGLIQPGPEPCYWETLCLASPQLVC